MPMNNSPPYSPPGPSPDDLEEIPFDEQDLIEVVEGDLPDIPPDSDDDDGNDDNDDDGQSADDFGPHLDSSPGRDDASLTFKKHKGSILSSTFHPKVNSVAVTGGSDEVAYVWDNDNGNILMACVGHDESVETVSFSYDGKYLATCDLSGHIKIWNTNEYTLFREFNMEDDYTWSQWHQGCNVLIAATHAGNIFMFKPFTGETKLVMTSFGSSCTCGKVFPDGKRLACGYSEGHLKIVDMKQATALSSLILNHNKDGVSCLDVHRDNNLVICGCTNGDVFLVSSQTGKMVAVLNSSKVSNMCNYIEAIAFCKDPTYNVAASASLDGNLIIWDVAKQVMRHRTCFINGLNQLVWHPSKSILFLSNTEGYASSYDAKTGNTLREFMGHRLCIYSLSLSSDGKKLLTTSEDATAKIFKTDEEAD